MKESTSLKITRSYGALLLGYACIEFVIRLLSKSTPVAQHAAVEVFHTISQLSALTVVLSPLNFLVGYGLFRQRKWALYVALTSLAFYPLQPFANWLLWGNHFATVPSLVTQTCSVILTFFFLYMQRDRGWWHLDDIAATRWKRSAVAIFVVLTCLYPILSPVSMRAFWAWKFHAPFFSPKPDVVLLHDPNDRSRRAALMDVSFLLPHEPKELFFSSLRDNKSAMVIYRGENRGKNWNLILSNDPTMIQVFDGPQFAPFKKMVGIKNNYDATKFMLTNNWNPIAYMPTMVYYLEGKPTMSEFRHRDVMGFVRKWDSNGRKHVAVQVFKSNDMSYREFELAFDDDCLSAPEVNDVISSITFLPRVSERQAPEEAKKGQQLLEQKNLLAAQEMFLNAYFHAPDKPDYLLMYLKTLPDGTEKQVKSLRYRLSEFLSKYPQNQEARSMDARLAIQHPISSATRK